MISLIQLYPSPRLLPPFNSPIVSDRYGNPKGTGSHWSCLCYAKGQAIHLDSMSPANNESAKLVFQKMSEIPNLSTNKFSEGKCPPQANGKWQYPNSNLCRECYSDKLTPFYS